MRLIQAPSLSGGSDSLAREFRMRRADGSYIWVQGMGLSVRGADGRATRFLASIADISERRAQEQALRDQVKLTRDLIDGNPNPVYLKDTGGRYVEVNDAWRRVARTTNSRRCSCVRSASSKARRSEMSMIEAM